MLTYQELTNSLKNKYKYIVSIKPIYTVITIPNTNYHITIYEDQWNNYQENTGKPYHLFHISSNNENNRCSSYFWVDMMTHRIKKIPRKYFSYNQLLYSLSSSTRSPCHLSDITQLLVVFQKMINEIKID